VKHLVDNQPVADNGKLNHPSDFGKRTS
jgi:hypothetical protein